MMRFDSSEIGDTMSEIVAYGTAVIKFSSGVIAYGYCVSAIWKSSAEAA